MKEIVLATHNPNKLREARAIFEPIGYEILGGADVNLPDIEETGKTCEENARLKAVEGFKALGKPVMADDSGICIDAMDGAPGVMSARYAAANGGFPAVFDVINNIIGDNPNRNAHYVCVMALAVSETEVYTFTGYMHGSLAHHPSGNGGFGYDPLFIPDGMETTLGHIPAEIKNKLSHRGKALKQVYDFLQTHQDINICQKNEKTNVTHKPFPTNVKQTIR